MDEDESRRVRKLTPERMTQNGKSDLACELCKRRKAKCDRVLPQCGPCSKTSQSCSYPSQRLKPGPKLGSHPRERKRSRNIDGSQTQPHRHPRRTAASRDYDQSAHAGLSPSSSQRAAPPSRVRIRFSDGASSGRASLPPSPRPTDHDDDTADMSDSSELAATNFVRAISLSSLIHPTHELPETTLSNATQVLTDGFFINLAGAQNLIAQACETMNVSVSGLQTLTDLYFDNMAAFSLFHKPSFGAKIQEIKTLAPLTAILASMFSVSARFQREASDSENLAESIDIPSSDQFHRIALRSVDDAIREIEDETPPLVVLQAMALCTFNELIRGVRGKGWRLLGSCVRIAYEQRLHLIDYDTPVSPPSRNSEVQRWVAKEEQRRCWWAIWEMDVFASTIRRSPLAIDWSMNETYLPADDEFWFRNTYSQSCFLDIRPNERWKKLRRSGNQNPAAWFIVLSSIMRNAQVLARGNLQGVRSESGCKDDSAVLRQYFRNAFRNRHSAADDEQLSFLTHALQRTISAMPESLAYRGEKLTFGTDTADTARPNREFLSGKQLDSARYSVFLMTQLARFQIFHHFAFGEIASGTIFTENSVAPAFGWTATLQPPPGSTSHCEGLRNCLEASDNIFAILNNTSESHIQWVNPFLASTVWLAASLQILRKVYTLRNSGEEEEESKFPLLRLTCQRYAEFWGTPLALLENVDSLEDRLMRKRQMMAEMEARCKERQYAARAGCGKKATNSVFETRGNGSEGKIREGGMNIRSTPVDLTGMADLRDLGSLFSTAESPSALGVTQCLSPPSTNPTAAAFLDWAPEQQTMLDDLSMAYVSNMSDHSVYPALETLEASGEIGNMKNGFDWFMSELTRSPMT